VWLVSSVTVWSFQLPFPTPIESHHIRPFFLPYTSCPRIFRSEFSSELGPRPMLFIYGCLFGQLSLILVGWLIYPQRAFSPSAIFFLEFFITIRFHEILPVASALDFFQVFFLRLGFRSRPFPFAFLQHTVVLCWSTIKMDLSEVGIESLAKIIISLSASLTRFDIARVFLHPL